MVDLSTAYWTKCLRDPGWVGNRLINDQIAGYLDLQSATISVLQRRLMEAYIKDGHHPCQAEKMIEKIKNEVAEIRGEHSRV